jgi:large subunit ribosomal protein L6
MKEKMYKNIEIPEGVEVSFEEDTLIVKGPEGENKREFNFGILDFEKKGSEIIIGSEKATKREKKQMNTITAHIKNMIKGVQEKFEYKLKICFSHFPMTLNVERNKAIIKNFLGEKIPRKVKIPEGVEIKVDKEIITINSTNKELAGQAAANFEKATKIRKKDRRIFQDGIFMISKCGREI